MNSESMTLGDRIRFAAKMAGGGKELSQKTGIPRSTLETYLTGQSEPQVTRMVEIAHAANVNVAWLATGDGPRLLEHGDTIDHFKKTGVLELGATIVPSSKVQSLEELGFVLVPRLSVQAGAGRGIMNEMDGDSWEMVAFRAEWLHRIGVHPNHAETLTAKGDSMEPLIRDGDLILVDRSIGRIVDHGIYVVTLAGMVLVKRVQMRRDGSIVLKSENTAYDDEVIPPSAIEELTIEGRVRWYGRTI